MNLGGSYLSGSGTGQRPSAPRPPNVFFDGTRLGLEGTMLSTLSVAIPSGLHIALAVNLGYAVRLEELSRIEPRSFALFGFILTAILAVVSMSMVLFFLLAIPTMGYSMGLVAFMLRWAGKRRGKERLASTVVGGVLGLIIGVAGSILVFMLMDLYPGWSTYAAIARWPEIMTIEGVALLWFSLNPLLNALAGVQIGWRLGKQVEEMTMYWFW